MKKEISLDELIGKFIEFSELTGKYLLSGEFRKLAKVAAAISNNKENAEYAFPIIMKSDLYMARTTGAVYALRTKLPSLESEAVQVLEAEKDRHDILGFGTRMALENYKKGRLM